MAKNKDSIYIRCNDKIKLDDSGVLSAKDIADYNRIQIDSLRMDYERLADFFAKFMAAICLNRMGYRAIGERSGIYICPEKADFNQLCQLINNCNGEILTKTAVKENLRQLCIRNYPEHQMAFDINGNIITEKSLDEILSELVAV